MDLLEPRDLRADVTAGFEAQFGRSPRAVGRAPGRVNLIGEHTDYNAGLCLPVALPHTTWAALAPRDDGVLRVSSAQRPGEVAVLEPDEVAPGRSAGWTAYVAGTVWALREAGWTVPGLDVSVHSTVPVGGGLSSSAALECSVGTAIAGMLGLALTDDVRSTLRRAGRRAEVEVVGVPTGGLDQAASMLSRPDHALLLDFDDESHEHVPLELAAAGLVLVVLDTRVSHALVDGGYAARRRDCEAAADRLGVASLRHAGDLTALESQPRLHRRARHVVSEIARVRRAVEACRAGDWPGLGELFVQSHQSLRDDYEVSSPELDLGVEVALRQGAFGARMTGGGFGGSLVALVRRADVPRMLEAWVGAFAAAGHRAPQALVAQPSGGAEVVAPA